MWQPAQPFGQHIAPLHPAVPIPDCRELSAALRAVLPFAAHGPSIEPHQVHLEARGDTLTVTAHDGTAFRRECVILPTHVELGSYTIGSGSAQDLARELGGRHREGFPCELHLVEVFTSAPEPRGYELLVRADGRIMFACEAQDAPHYDNRLIARFAGTHLSGDVP